MSSRAAIATKPILRVSTRTLGQSLRVVLVAVLAAAYLLPVTVGAGEPVTAHAEGFYECPEEPDALWVHPLVWPYPICGIYARANWTVEACDASTCTVRVDTHSNAWAMHPGVLHLETMSHPGMGSACIGPKVVSDRLQDVAPCHRVCQTVQVSWTASCVGTKTVTLDVSPGYCNTFHIAEAFWVDGGLMGGGNVFWFAYVCRTSGGTPYFDVY